MKPTNEELLAAYDKDLREKIANMTDEEVAEKLAEFEAEEAELEMAKLAEDSQALGRFAHEGYRAGMDDLSDLLEKHAEADDPVGAAIEEFEADMQKFAGEIAEAEERAEKLASEEAEAEGEGEELSQSPEDIALAAAIEADPDAIKTAALQVLRDRGIGIYEFDAAGNPVRELQLS